MIFIVIMTRKEEITKAGIEYTIANKPKCIAGDNFKDSADILNRNPDFEAGAEWADAHPHWISVADELPDEGKYAVTINKFGFQAVQMKHKFFHDPRMVCLWCKNKNVKVISITFVPNGGFCVFYRDEISK